MFRIGIISDTHGGLPLAVHTVFEGVDAIIHAGDIGGLCVLDELETIAPVTAVLGNCDFAEYGCEVRSFAKKVFDGVHILVVHRPKDLKAALSGWGSRDMGALAPGEPLPQVVIHGHTHTPQKERKGAILWLCPGSPNCPRASEPSVMLLTLDAGTILNVELVAL